MTIAGDTAITAPANRVRLAIEVNGQRVVDDMLDVDLFIIVEYGTSIAEVCKTIVQTVRYKLESMTGVKVRRVNISVEGVRV